MIQASQIAAGMGRPATIAGEPAPRGEQNEGAVLSAAIQRLISERDRHKGVAASQEDEMIRLRAVNEELRRQNEELARTRDRYLGLAAELLAQMQQVSSAIREALQRSRGVAEGGDETIAALARRFSPQRNANESVG
jgi:predicted RNase H-like nuclease (RuvC/YqgF family)